MSIASDVQLSIHSFYSGEIDAGLRSCERLLNNPNAESHHELALTNRIYYIRPLYETIPIIYQKLSIPGLPTEFNAMNPSVLATKSGYLVNVRLVNYQIIDGSYVISDGSQVIRTENALIELNEHAQYEGHTILSRMAYDSSDFPVDGLEDVRLYSDGENLHGSATVRNFKEYGGHAVITDFKIKNGHVHELKAIKSNKTQAIEKNWAPVIGRPGLWCYHHGPTTQMIGRSGVLSNVGEAPSITKLFRGSSQIIPFRDGYLSVIHEVSMLNERRVYNHRFVEFNSALRLSRIGIPFYIKTSKTIEFVAGLTCSTDRKSLILSFGHEDKEAWLAHVKVQDLSKLFEY